MLATLKDLVNLFPSRGDGVYARIFDGTKFIPTTYVQLYEALQKTAAYLQSEKKLKKGDMVLLSSENRPEWQISYLGISSNGLIGVPLDANLTADEVQTLINDCKASHMFVSGGIYNKLKGNPEIMKMIKHWVVFDPFPTPPANVDFLPNILSKAMLPFTANTVLPEDPASLIYTSGTTGFAKAVILLHKNFAHQCNNLVPLAKLVPSDVIMSILPLHHTYMFSVEIASISSGCSITYVESLKPARILAAVKETGITVMIGIPMLFQKILDGVYNKINALTGITKTMVVLFRCISTLGFKLTGGYGVGKVLFRSLREKAGFGTVRYLVSGAGPLAQKTAEGFAVLGFNLANGYGLTEAAPIVSVNPPDGPIDNKSVGVLPANTWWRIDSPNSEGIGEICVRGENIMKGYYNNPEATASAIDPKGWLHTGDMGYIGTIKGREYLYITGRLKNIIVTTGGKNIYPEEIEELINAHPHVMESVILGVPNSDTDAGENPCALVVVNLPLLEEQGITDIEAVKASVQQHIREVNKKLKNYQVLRGWEIRTEELLKNTTRKVKRFEYKGKDYRYLIK